jgi:hypothetical protein
MIAEAKNCQDLPKVEVCGYDHTVYNNDKEKDHALPYKNVCFYCQAFGEDGVREVVATKVTAFGYQKGACN